LLSKNINVEIYRIITLSFDLCGRETAFTLRGERELNRVLKGIFGPRREDVTGEWK